MKERMQTRCPCTGLERVHCEASRPEKPSLGWIVCATSYKTEVNSKSQLVFMSQKGGNQ